MRLLTYNEIVRTEIESLLKYSPESVQEMRKVKECDLIKYHSTYGRYLRNEYKLWDLTNP